MTNWNWRVNLKKKIKTSKIRNQENKDQIQKQNKLSGSFENLQGRQKN
jgi:hypothetical protein